jgi:hypothetical protein
MSEIFRFSFASSAATHRSASGVSSRGTVTSFSWARVSRCRAADSFVYRSTSTPGSRTFPLLSFCGMVDP